jgi:hypothetical protein
LLSLRHKVFIWLGPFLVVNWLMLAFVNPESPRLGVSAIKIGYLIGSLFAHATLAAAWTALGPAALIWRLPLSLVWIMMLAIALAVNMGVNGRRIDEFPVFFGTLVFGQWLVLQFPFWALKAGFRFQLQHTDDERSLDPQQWQFGIRQLMIVTAIVGIIFGIGRVVIPHLSRAVDGESLLFVWLSVCAVISSLPLLLAALMRRGAVFGVLLVLAMIGGGTYLEVPLLRNVAKSGPRPNIYDLLSVNGFTCGVILVTAATVRMCGYSLTRRLNGKSKMAI